MSGHGERELSNAMLRMAIRVVVHRRTGVVNWMRLRLVLWRKAVRPDLKCACLPCESVEAV